MKKTPHYLLMSEHLMFQKALVSSVKDTGLTPGHQPKIPDYLLHHDGVIHCRHFTKTDWGNANNYDLCIKSDDLGMSGTAQIIADLFQKKIKF